jgi:hypothetical protein
MSSTGGAPTPAGWYADPAGSTQLRWWDGTAWTAHLAAPPAPAPTSVPEPQYAAPSHFAVEPTPYVPMGGTNAPAASSGTTSPGTGYGAGYGAQSVQVYEPGSSNTAGVWIVALSPIYSALLVLVALFLIYQNPSAIEIIYVADVGASGVVAAIIVFAAARDRRALFLRGYDNPASFWWALLNPVYLIVRTVRVLREVHRGGAPLWTWIGAWICAIVLTIVGSVVMLPVFLNSSTVRTGTSLAASIQNGMDSRGGNYLVTCPPTVSFVLGTEFSCTALDEANGQSHTLLIDVVSGSDGRPTVSLKSVTPPIP